MNRVLITGVGAVSSVGIGKDAFWSAIANGKSGISAIELFDTSAYSNKYAGEIKNFDPSVFLPGMKTEKISRSLGFAASAAALALKDAGINTEILKTKNCAILAASAFADPQNKHEAFFLHSIARELGAFFNIAGPNMLISGGSTSAALSLGYAYDLIKKGELDITIAGGAEALSLIAYQGFQRLYAMAPEFCAPFDKNRKGMLLGEGSGMLILESESSAKQRKATAYAELLGYGLSCNAPNITLPKKEGIYKAIDKALRSADITVADIDYICANGSGTQEDDLEESLAITDFFGTRHNAIAVSSIKSMLGNSMGAAAALEAVACSLAISNNTIPPTINLQTPDPECEIDCVANVSRKTPLDTVLHNSFGICGNNCSIIYQRY